MKILDLTPENEKLYTLCLEDWSEEVAEAGNHKACWLERNRAHARVKLAADDAGNIGGMIQYLPIEKSGVQGKDLFFILCIWVHGHKQGRGNFQKKGMGSALLKAAEDDAKQRGAKGIAAWGVSLPFWMKASWFKKHGYERVDKEGVAVLLWKKFSDDARPPKWTRPKKYPGTVPGKVAVTAFLGGWCTSYNIVFERAKKASAEFGDKVVFQHIDTSNSQAFQEWGISDALFIDGKEVSTGPPPSYEKLKKMIGKRVKKLR
jgi:N-acetylglutamate synthase-like GNAT family acetyltransferase